jgi:HlyD family secretion protein
VAARITAPIKELKVRKGDVVSAGQVLALLEDRDVVAQRSEAQAGVQDIQNTQATDVERARGQVAVAKAALNQTQKTYERRRELFAQGAIPNRDLLVSQTEYEQAKTNLEVAQKALELLESSPGKPGGIAQSRMEQARARLAISEAQLAYTVLRSPFAGVVTEQFLFPGDMAKPEAPVFTVMDLAVVVARAQVPESEAAGVAVGQTCVFRSADQADSEHPGRVTVVNNAVDPARRTVEVWCDIANPKHELRASVFGQLTVATATKPNSIIVPQSAVELSTGTRTGWVYVVDSKKIAHKTEVEVGEVFDGKIQIVKGLKGGEQVVVDGGYALPDGTQVELASEKPAEKPAEKKEEGKK